MLGAIAGDIIGSVYEGLSNNIKITDFPLFSAGSTFTDDTVLSVAVADCILNNKHYVTAFREYGRRYPAAGYGGNFREWLISDNPKPYYSCGNGSAMRVSPVGFAFYTMERVLEEARRSAEVTHNHPEGIKGAQATASAIFLAREGRSKVEIKNYIESTFNYNLHRTLEEIRADYGFDATCQGTVPQAIIAFLDSSDFEDAVRKAISLGGDSDTIACIAGGIAQAFYKIIPQEIIDKTKQKLTPDLLNIVEEFNKAFNLHENL